MAGLDLLADGEGLGRVPRRPVAQKATHNPAAAVVGLPQGGVDLVGDLVAANRGAAALVLTGSGCPVRHARAREAGAVAVVHKAAPIGEVIEVVSRLTGEDAD